MTSMTQRFIDTFSTGTELDEGVIGTITKQDFENKIKTATKERFYEINTCKLEAAPPHPLQTVYLVSDSMETYDNGSFEDELNFVFKYKGKYYEFYQYCCG